MYKLLNIDMEAAHELEGVFADLLKRSKTTTDEPRAVARKLIEALDCLGYRIDRAASDEVVTIECGDDAEADELFGRPASIEDVDMLPALFYRSLVANEA